LILNPIEDFETTSKTELKRTLDRNMYAAQHADACYKKFGKTYYEVHHFLDQYEKQFPGYPHRRLLQHKLGVEVVVQHLGEDARGSAELHIRQDLDGQLPEDWAEFDGQYIPNAEDIDKQNDILRKLYGDELFEQINLRVCLDK
jgi:hypothetical protein